MVQKKLTARTIYCVGVGCQEMVVKARWKGVQIDRWRRGEHWDC